MVCSIRRSCIRSRWTACAAWWWTGGLERSSRWPIASSSTSPKATSCGCARAASKSAPGSPSCSVWAIRRRLLQRLDGVREAALVTVPCITVQDALRHHAVDHALRLLQRGERGVLVAGRHRLADLLDRGAHGGAQRHVVVAPLERLPGALARGFGVRHEGCGSRKRGEILTRTGR